MKPGKRKILRIVYATFLIFLGAVAIRTLYYVRGDHQALLLEGYEKYISTESILISSDDSSSTYNIILKRNGRPDLNCYLRIPLSDEPSPAVILLGGLVTGKDVVDLVGETEIANKLVVMTMDYPYEGKKRKVPPFEFLSEIPAMRRAIFDSVSAVMLMTDHLLTLEEVNPEQIIFAGGSFGAFFAIAAGALDERAKAVVSMYAGGDISLLISHDLDWKPEIAQKFAGWLVELLVLPVEPLNWVKNIAPRPFLMINGKNDERIAKEGIDKLFHAAGEPKELIWHESGHVVPESRKLTQQLTEMMGEWLKKEGLVGEHL